MTDKKLQQLNNRRTDIVPGDQFAIGGADGFTYRAELTVLQSFLLDSGLTTSTIKAPQSAVVKAAIDAINTILTTDNASLDDLQKITNAIETIQSTLSVNDAAYDTLQKIADKLKAAETTLSNLGTASIKDVGTAIGNLQENGADLDNLQIVETDAVGKFITTAKNTAYNKNFGTSNTDVARGDASFLKADTYTQTAINNAFVANSTDDRARANHTGEQAIATVTGLQTALDAKEDNANKGVANGYAGLDSNAQVPLSQIPANAKSSKVVADISTRDVIASADRFEGLRVHVLDASADGTVTSGSAGYILKSGLTNADWGKTYESESLDIDLSDYFNTTTDTTDNITEGTAKFITQANIDKLAGIEPNATADQTPAEIKTAYETNSDTNAFTDADKDKLTGIEQYATADQSDLEIKTAYEANLNTNAFTDADKNNLSNQSGTNTGDETTASIQTKRPLKSVQGQTVEGTGNIELTKADIGLANVDNTSDADKPISTATQAALDGKLAKASNFTDVASRQTALNNLTDAGSAINGYILTKNGTTGDAEWLPVPGGAGGTNLSISVITGTTLNINSDTGNDATIPGATISGAGLLSSADKAKLDGVQANATANVPATETVAGIGEIATQAEAEAGTDDTNKFLNALKVKQAFDAFLAQQFGTSSGTVAEGDDSRFLVKRLNVLIGSSPNSQKKGVSFNFGATITNPFFSFAITSGGTNEAFCVKIIDITTTSGKLEVYKADGSNWNDANVACFITIYSGTY